MNKLKYFLFRSWYELDSLENRIYHIILDVAVFVSVASVAAGLLLHSPRRAVLSSALILLFLIVLQTITMRLPQYSEPCRIIMVYGFNLLLLPISFFASGGIYSGEILFFLLGMAMCAVLVRGSFGGITFLISAFVMELVILFSVHFPQPGYAGIASPGRHGVVFHRASDPPFI